MQEISIPKDRKGHRVEFRIKTIQNIPALLPYRASDLLAVKLFLFARSFKFSGAGPPYETVFHHYKNTMKSSLHLILLKGVSLVTSYDHIR